jgi:nucleotide-binding universal stress UspA family protein
MKVKPSDQSGGVAIELSPKESQIPLPASLFKLKKILAPVDFSECSAKALEYAEAMAKQFDAELILVHVTQQYMPVTELAIVEMTTMLDEARAAEKKNLADLEASIDAHVDSRSITRSGQPYHEIITAAEELDVDLIVISTHGRTGLAHTFMGSTTERVVRHAKCPVLVVREREHDFLAT